MTDSSSFSSESSQEEVTHTSVPTPEHESRSTDPIPTVNGDSGRVVNGVSHSDEEEPREEERTLTDHLNKRLLESFLARLDSGSMELPPGVRGSDPPEEEEEDVQEFED